MMSHIAILGQVQPIQLFPEIQYLGETRDSQVVREIKGDFSDFWEALAGGGRNWQVFEARTRSTTFRSEVEMMMLPPTIKMASQAASSYYVYRFATTGQLGTTAMMVYAFKAYPK